MNKILECILCKQMELSWNTGTNQDGKEISLCVKCWWKNKHKGTIYLGEDGKVKDTN